MGMVLYFSQPASDGVLLLILAELLAEAFALQTERNEIL